MITLTLSVPDNDAIMGAGFIKIRGKRHSGGASAPAVTTVPDITLVAGQLAYTLVDPMGAPTDWFGSVYVDGGGSESSESAPQPGYLSDLMAAAMDLLGMTPDQVSNAQLQGLGYLPTAYAKARERCPTFDTLVAAGGDAAQLCLGALANLLAALLCDRAKVWVVDSETFKDYKYQRNKVMDWDDTRDNLLDRYNELIGIAQGESATADSVYVPPMGLSGPTRAGLDTSAGLVPLQDGSGIENPLTPYSVIPPQV